MGDLPEIKEPGTSLHQKAVPPPPLTSDWAHFPSSVQVFLALPALKGLDVALFGLPVLFLPELLNGQFVLFI